MRDFSASISFLLLLIVSVIGCDASQTSSDTAAGTSQAAQGGPFSFAPPVFDIAAAPNGSILVAETVFPETDIPLPGEESITTVKEILRNGSVREVSQISTVQGTPINGLEAIGSGNFFATSGAVDLAVGARVLRVSHGGNQVVGDIEAFETANDPDALEGLQWKDPLCEFNPAQGYSAGPQSNPYHVAQLSGNTALVADAAGNTLLVADGGVDWIAVLSPPTADGSGSDQPSDWLVLFPLDDTTDCYVQPVATSVAIGPDGAYYVGELTGVTAEELGGGTSTGLSRVWRIAPGARNVTCPSADCEVVLDGLTSVVDLAFGPDDKLYVVEYDEAGWWTSTVLGNPAGGTINRCDTNTGACDVVEEGLALASAITFDKWGQLWLLENNIVAPTVRQVNLP